MSFKLDKTDTKRRADLVAELREKWGKIEDAVAVYNAAVVELHAPLAAVIADYNETVEEARGFAEDVANQADSDINDKSDNWQDGDKGQAAAEWRDAWQSVELEEIDLGEPEELAIDDPEHAEGLEGLPARADE